MIKHLPLSQDDTDILTKINHLNGLQDIDSTDYMGKIVDKPWGYEYLMFQNDFVAIWILFLKKDFATSMHCHPCKKTSLTVLSGQVETSSLNSKTTLNESDGIVIDKATFHSTKATSPDGAFIMEIETPPNKTDLVRYKDSNGRTTSQYEDAKKNDSNSEYTHVFFDEELENNKYFEKQFLNKTISIGSHDTLEKLVEHLNDKKSGIICPLININHINEFELGSIIHAHELSTFKKCSEEDQKLSIETLIIY